MRQFAPEKHPGQKRANELTRNTDAPAPKGATFRPRECQTDIFVDARGNAPVPRNCQNIDGEHDYFENFKKFHRTEDMAAPPTREKGPKQD